MPSVKTVLTLFVVVAVASFAGCSSGGSAASQPALVAAANSPITDVPVPAGFSMRSSSWSHVIPGSSQRFVNHEYRGSDGYLAVARFYKEQMPAHGWTLLSQQQFDEIVTLNFAKNNEPATITITEGTFHTTINVQVNLGVRPGVPH